MEREHAVTHSPDLLEQVGEDGRRFAMDCREGFAKAMGSIPVVGSMLSPSAQIGSGQVRSRPQPSSIQRQGAQTRHPSGSVNNSPPVSLQDSPPLFLVLPGPQSTDHTNHNPPSTASLTPLAIFRSPTPLVKCPFVKEQSHILLLTAQLFAGKYTSQYPCQCPSPYQNSEDSIPVAFTGRARMRTRRGRNGLASSDISPHIRRLVSEMASQRAL